MAAVSAGAISVVQAFPDLFPGANDQGDQGAFPSAGADMSGFRLEEEATPESVTRDIELLEALAQNQHLRVTEDAAPGPPGEPALPHPEWT